MRGMKEERERFESSVLGEGRGGDGGDGRKREGG